MRLTLPAALFLFILLASCRSGPEPVPQRLSDTYADLLTYRNASRTLDSASYAAGVDSVLAVHGYDRESFGRAFGRIGSSTDQVNAFFDSANVRILPPGRR